MESNENRAGAPSLRVRSASPARITVTSAASATGNPRNKCALRPGHSLMDWIRLGNSGRDLSGVAGRPRPVTAADLAKHRTPDDAWLAIRGNVYNITHYLPYHPGGEDELMKGAGRDATQLFDEVHPWVNFESLLAKCLVGPLRAGVADRLQEPSRTLVRRSMENLANCITPVLRKAADAPPAARHISPSRIVQCLVSSSELPVSIGRQCIAPPAAPADPSPPPPAASPSPAPSAAPDAAPPEAPRTDWIQTSGEVTLVFYTHPFCDPSVLVEPGSDERTAAVTLAYEGCAWRFAAALEGAAAWREAALASWRESGKVEVRVRKAARALWSCAGEVRCAAGAVPHAGRSLALRVREARDETHDSRLLTLEGAGGERWLLPVGAHVRVHAAVGGARVTRCYTPLEDLRLLVKRYAGGALSPRLAALVPGDLLEVDGPHGNFSIQQTRSASGLLVLAAGTGITPMLPLVRFMLARRSPRCSLVRLLFFNKTERDMLLRDLLKRLAEEDDRFEVVHVLSEAEDAWAGARGRVSAELLRASALPPAAGPALAAVCGPAPFTDAARLLLAEHLPDVAIHAFLG